MMPPGIDAPGIDPQGWDAPGIDARLESERRRAGVLPVPSACGKKTMKAEVSSWA